MADNNIYNSALSRAMALCSQREYCTGDIRAKLRSWSVGEPDSEKIIMELIREKFIDEKRYAEAFVKDKFRYNKWGIIKIRAELKMKGIPGGITDQAISTIDKEYYRNALEELLLAHRRSIKAKNQYDLKGKLLRYGLSKGYESTLLYEIISRKFKDIDQEGHESCEEEL